MMNKKIGLDFGKILLIIVNNLKILSSLSIFLSGVSMLKILKIITLSNLHYII